MYDAGVFVRGAVAAACSGQVARYAWSNKVLNLSLFFSRNAPGNYVLAAVRILSAEEDLLMRN